MAADPLPPLPPLPIKLKKQPIVDAIFEIRFSSAAPASNVIPGILLSKFRDLRIERLAAAEIPTKIRALDPNLNSQPLARLHWADGFTILVGDTGLGIASKRPYPGWGSFKPRIIELYREVFAFKFVEQIERYSLKSVSVIDGKDLGQQIGRVNIDFRFGHHQLKAEPFLFRAEMQEEPGLYIVQLAAPASVTTAEGGVPRTGLLIDIDGIRDHKTSNLDQFLQELPHRAEQLHERNKQLFFGLLTPETLSYLEPIYEPVSG